MNIKEYDSDIYCLVDKRHVSRLIEDYSKPDEFDTFNEAYISFGVMVALFLFGFVSEAEFDKFNVSRLYFIAKRGREIK